jgi:hypothetical protein
MNLTHLVLNSAVPLLATLVMLACVAMFFAVRAGLAKVPSDADAPPRRRRFGIGNALRLFSGLKRFLVARALGINLSWRRHNPATASMCNGNVIGVHPNGILSYYTDAAIARYTLVKFGSDGTHVTNAGAADQPTLLALDECTAASTIPQAFASLPSQKGTVKLISDGSALIAVGDLLVPAANGKVKTIAAGAGNYWVVGRALTAVANAATGSDAELEAESLITGLTK